MYPASHAAALLEQLETERAITELVELALELWLPLAQDAVLDTGQAPDASAAADKEAQWDYLVDSIIIYGIGIIAGDAFMRANAVLESNPDADALTAASFLGRDMPGMPNRTSLRRKAAAILKRRRSIDTDAVEAEIEANANVRQFVAGHVDNIRGRVLDAVGRLFRRVRKATDEGADVEEIFEPLDEGWESAADQVGQTQATGALNAAVARASEQARREIEIEWVAILDTHTRLAHEQADGQRQQPGVSFDVGGEQLRFPADPLGEPENIINCRCRLFAFFADEPGFNDSRQASGDPGTSHAFEKVATMADYRSFTSVLAVIGTPTDDGRMFASDIALSFRDFPLPLLWQKQSAGGHYDAYTVGVIESAGVVGNEVIGKGYMLATAEASEAAMQIEHGVTGPSVDLGDTEWEMRDSAGNVITEEMWWDDPDMEVLQVVLSAKVLAATLVATPAFGQTSIALGEMVAKGEEALVAAAALMSVLDARPAKPNAAAFTDPGFTEPTYPHITDDGVIRGHLAAFNTCHIGIQDRCVKAPRSQTDYAWFHTSPPVQLADGGTVKVGRLTVGGGHAGPKMGVGATVAHYDNVGTCFALVHVGEDEHGIWFSGIPAPGATIEQIEKGLAAPLSGDWRSVAGNLELVAALAVNTPGFPLIASGATDDDDMPYALVASLGPCPGDPTPAADSRDLATIVRETVTALRAQDKRDADAKALIHREIGRQAAALIQEMS